MHGIIARLMVGKGFGFIRGTDGSERFFHRSSVLGAGFDSLREGQDVTFEDEASAKGPRATNVRAA